MMNYILAFGFGAFVGHYLFRQQIIPALAQLVEKLTQHDMRLAQLGETIIHTAAQLKAEGKGILALRLVTDTKNALIREEEMKDSDIRAAKDAGINVDEALKVHATLAKQRECLEELEKEISGLIGVKSDSPTFPKN